MLNNSAAFIQLNMPVIAIDGLVGYIGGIEPQGLLLHLNGECSLRQLTADHVDRVRDGHVYLSINKASLAFLPIVQNLQVNPCT